MSCQTLIENVLAAGRNHLLEPEAYRVCQEFAITCPEFKYAASLAEGINAAKSIGFPVVIKVVSPHVLHKTDVGGVVVGIDSEEQFIKAYNTMLDQVRNKARVAEINGVLVQKAMSQGVEAAVGGLRDPQFGPVVMFGTGGTLIEVWQDVSFRLAPLDREEALRQIKETKVFKVLQGLRHKEPCNIEALADLIVRAGDLLVEIPEITELDFNPVLSYPDRCVAVDARIIINRQ